jgi:hypothetical protein
MAIGQAAALVLVIAQAEVRELEIVQVEAVLVRARAVKLVTAQPQGHHLEVLAKTKSVTALRPRGLHPLLTAEEDLAAAAATMREPAVAEAVTAWEAGG